MGHTGTLTRGYGSAGPALATLTPPESPARLVTLSTAPAPLRRPIPAPRPRPGVVPLAVRPGTCPARPRTAFVPPPAPAGLAHARPVPQRPLPPVGGPMTGVARAVRRALPDVPPLPRPARPGIGWGPQAATGRVLIAAVAVGAAMPALSTLGTHEAEAEPTTATQVARTDLALAAQRGPAVAAASSAAAVAAVSSVTTVRVPTSGASDPTAGDATDMAALTKAIGVARESGPLEFGRPYQAGNDKNLDGQIAKALGLLGLPQKLAPGVKKIIMRESTGNPDAVNNWDSNASAGTPSKGLMQLIDVSFHNSVLPSVADRGIYDPVANITAGVRTMIANHSIDDVVAGGLKNSSGNYIGYGGAKLPDDGLS